LRKALLVLCSVMVLLSVVGTPNKVGVAHAAPATPGAAEPQTAAPGVQGDPQLKQMAPGWHYAPLTGARPAAPSGTGIADGGFEAGSPNPFWSEYSQKIGTPICSYDICGNAGGAVFPHQDDYYLWFGGNLYGDNGYVEQQVTIPRATPILTFYLWIELAGSNDTDYLRIKVDNDTVFTADVRRSNRAYQFVAVDLNSYKGTTPHTLRIEGATHGPANFLIDDLGLTGAIGPSSVAQTGPQVGIVNTAYTFAVNTPLYTTKPITYTWDATEQATAFHGNAGLTDTVGFTFAITGVKTITITAANTGGSITGLQNMYVEPTPQIGTVGAAALPALRRGSVDWGDFDNDGKLDVLLTGAQWDGVTSSYVPATLLYRNNGDGTFTPIAAGLPGILDGAGRWGDFNNDGKLDLLLVGWGDWDNDDKTPNIASTRLFRNDGSAGPNAWTFTDTGEPFTPLSRANAAWADYNGDGKLDFLITGLEGLLGTNTILYTNGGGPAWHFSANGDASLPTLYAGSIDWGDINQDGLPDLLLTGCRSDVDGCKNHLTEIYRNQGWDAQYGVWTFANIHAGLTNVGHSAAKFADYDADGLPDVALAGCINSNPDMACDANVTQVWHNDGDEYFSKRVDLPGVRDAALAWGDFDNDGRQDILLSGDSGTGYAARIFQNNGNQIFTDISAGFTGAVGTATWADYNNDTMLDMLLTGQTGGDGSDMTRLYGNITEWPNSLPTAPGELKAVPELDGVHLSWGTSSDRETPTNSMTYNVRIGTTPGGFDVMGPMADLATGVRRIAARGNAPASRRLDVTGLASGTKYYWSVQALDASFAGSPFAAEGSFTTLVPTPPSSISLTGPANGAVTTVNTMNVFTFTANIEPISSTLPFTYTWTADGQPAHTWSKQGRSYAQTYSWNSSGVKNITVTAWNDRGRVTATHTITVGLPLDSISVAGPATAVVDRSYAFTVTALPSGTQTPITYIWDVTDNGRHQYDGAGITQSKSFTWHTSGRKAVRVIAQNPLGTVIKTVFVNISVPLKGAELTGPAEGVVGQGYTFAGEADPLTATLPITYTWSATDIAAKASSGHQATDSHVFTWTTPGLKVVTLAAKNLNGIGNVSVTREVTINAPVEGVTINWPAQVAVGKPYVFTAQSSPLTATVPVTYTWTATENGTETAAGDLSQNKTFTWQTPGPKTVVVTTDNRWGTATHTFTVTAETPVTGIRTGGPDFGAINQSYAFTTAVLPLTTTLPMTFTWSAADASPQVNTGHRLTDTGHLRFSTAGLKTVTVVAANAVSAITATRQITIQMPVASVSVTGRAVGVVGLGYVFTASAGPAGASGPLTYVWQADGQVPITNTVSSATDRVTFTWPDKGTKTVSVTVTNAVGAATNSRTIKIGYAVYLPALRKP
jgi:hypothetical protein